MKFHIYEDKGGEWRWNAQAGGNILFSSGEGFEKPQKAVAALRKHIVREDEKLEKNLVKALKDAGLDEKGGKAKAAVEVDKATKAAPPKAAKEKRVRVAL